MKRSRLLVGHFFQAIALISMIATTLFLVVTDLGVIRAAILGSIAICLYFLGAAVLASTNRAP